MCEREGVPCEAVTGIGGVQEGACELLAQALVARDSAQLLPVRGLSECPLKPRIQVQPAQHDFGVTQPGVAATRLATIRVTNIGDAPLTLSAVQLLPPDHFRILVNPAGKSIAVHATGSFDVECRPTAQGGFGCNLSIASDAANVDSPVLVLLNVIAGYPEIAITPASHDFGEVLVGGSSAPVRFVITNPGVVDLTLTGAQFSGAGFDMVPAQLNAVVAPRDMSPQAHLELTVTARPGKAGPAKADLTVDCDARAQGHATVRLAVTGVCPEIAVDEERLDFGELLVGAGAQHTFTLTNTGSAPLTITGISLEGDKDFTFAAEPRKTTLRVEQSIGRGQQWSFAIAAQCTATGARAASIVIGSDAQNRKEPLRLGLAATGVRPEIRVDSRQCSFGDALVGGEGNKRRVVVTNPGSAPLHITGVALSDTAHFTLCGDTTPPSQLAPASKDADARWVIELLGLPTEPGRHDARLLIQSDAGNEQEPLAVALDVRGVAPDIGIDLPLKDFASVLLGATRPQLFTLTNTGDAPLNLRTIALDDEAHFMASDLPAMHAPIGVGESRTFRIMSRPGLPGVQRASVTIHSDARRGPLVVPLTVTGLQPTVAILPSPAAVLFNADAPNSTALTATGTPGGGHFAWIIDAPDTANFPGGVEPGDTAQVNIAGLLPGTTNVTVKYTVGTAPVATDTVAFHVVQVVITQGDRLAVVHPAGGAAANRVLNAVGTPGGGNPVFQALTHNGATAVRYQGNVTTVANHNATIVTRARGRSTARVTYSLAGVIADASINVNVTTLACSKVTWAPAGAANVAPVAIDPCPHEDAFEQPHAAVPTALPAAPHHHGDACFYCLQSGRPVHHYVESGTGSDAVAAVTQLRDEIHQLRALLPAAFPLVAMPAAAAQYIANHPWLDNVPVYILDPAGWAPPCRRCNGTGIFQATCGRCSGSGRRGGGNCFGCGGAGTHGVNCKACAGTGSRFAQPNGRMIGVLIARDAEGRTYRLRGVSSTFPGTRVGPAPPLDPRPDEQFGAPNAYWARQLPNQMQIPSASHGVHTYASPGDTFGKCAATHMLAQALDQQLEVVSMAEIWVGATYNGKVDGQLQTSCPHCREYFEHMLCDRGAQPRSRPYLGAAAARHRGQLVAIQEGPTVYLSPAPAQVLLHGLVNAAVGRLLAWTAAPGGVVNFVGATNQPNATVQAAGPGTTAVTLRQTLYGANTTANVALHVLSIAQAGPLDLPLAQAAGRAVSVPALPGNGTLQWQLADATVVRFAGAPAPGNVTTVTVQPLRLGSTQLTVDVLVNGAPTGATAAITINVT